MKRYTARLRLLDSQLNAAQIKTAVESELLRAPITFKVGAIAPAEGDIVLVEIASDAKRADLVRALQGAELTRRLKLDHVGWGWLITGATAKSTSGMPATEHDPYATAQTQAEGAKEYVCHTRQLAFWQITGFIFVIGLVVVSVLFVLELRLLGAARVLVYIGLIYIPFFVSTSLTLLAYYASGIRCDQAGIEVKY